MANEDHVRIVLAGTESIGKWKDENPNDILDLRNASLRRAELVRADLNKAILRGADLEWADLRWADLINADLTGCNLLRADFHKADLSSAKLCKSNLTKCNLEDANITNSDFSGAVFSNTRLLNLDLKMAVGLDTCKHIDISIFDRDTIAMSGNISNKFLEGIGLYSSYHAAVYRIAIGSPSDVMAERNIARESIYSWNDHHSHRSRTVLLPVMWETHATPELGDDPQNIINKQVLPGCQMLIGIFWTRLGTQTKLAASGTVEEIDRFREEGKPVMVYFCSRSLPQDIDIQQWDALMKFKERLQKQGLIDYFDSAEELARKLNRHLTSTVERMFRGN